MKLATIYYNGVDVPQNLESARRWFEMAATQGNPTAQFNLGVMQFNAEGGKQDVEQAILWFEQAAQQELAVAQYTLGMFYQDGKVVERNLERARHWLNRAALNVTSGDDFLDDLARRIRLLLTDPDNA